MVAHTFPAKVGRNLDPHLRFQPLSPVLSSQVYVILAYLNVVIWPLEMPECRDDDGLAGREGSVYAVRKPSSMQAEVSAKLAGWYAVTHALEGSPINSLIPPG